MAAGVAKAIAAEFDGWVGRSLSTADEVALQTVRRAATMSDLDPSTFQRGDPLPPHWYSMFCTQNALQSQLGADGHPRKGDFLPPAPLPRRMFVGRSVVFHKPLTIGCDVRKDSRIARIEGKDGRSGPLVFVDVEHSFSAADGLCLVETQRVVYRSASQAEAESKPLVGETASYESEWTRERMVDPPLSFRYSALTWNGHRIHYDSDYAREVEGYGACLVNGALTVHLIVDAVLARTPGQTLKTLDARLSRPIHVGASFIIAGRATAGASISEIEAWAECGSNRELAAHVKLRFA